MDGIIIYGSYIVKELIWHIRPPAHCLDEGVLKRCITFIPCFLLSVLYNLLLWPKKSPKTLSFFSVTLWLPTGLQAQFSSENRLKDYPRWGWTRWTSPTLTSSVRRSSRSPGRSAPTRSRSPSGGCISSLSAASSGPTRISPWVFVTAYAVCNCPELIW